MFGFSATQGAEQSAFNVRFDKTVYHIAEGEAVTGEVLLAPAPADGLFSYGVRLRVNGPPNIPLAPPILEATAALNFNAVRGPGAISQSAGALAAVKGTVNFYNDPLRSHFEEVLGSFRVTGLVGGPWELQLELFNTLGPTEQIFVDGTGAVLDDGIEFGTAAINFLPTVAILSPSDGASFVLPGAVTVRVEASDSDGAIRKVELFVGNELLAQADGPVLDLAWNNPAVGTHVLTAVATDDSGGSRQSSPISITIRERLGELTAIFAGRANKPAGSRVLNWAGGDNQAEGKVHSNSDINLSGNKHHFNNGLIEYVTGFKPDDFAKKATLENAVLKASTVQPYPLDFKISDFAPGGVYAQRAAQHGKYFQVRKNTSLSPYTQNGVLREGLYFVDGRVHLDGKARGKATIVATEEIHVSGNGGVFEPYESCLWLFSARAVQNVQTGESWGDGNGIKISGSSINWSGIIFAPNGPIEISGANNVAQPGSLIGDEVQVIGSGFRLKGADLFLCRPAASPALANGKVSGLSVSSGPAILEIKRQADRILLSILTANSIGYVVESADSLRDPVWKDFLEFRADGSVTVLELPLEGASRFYRVRTHGAEVRP